MRRRTAEEVAADLNRVLDSVETRKYKETQDRLEKKFKDQDRLTKLQQHVTDNLKAWADGKPPGEGWKWTADEREYGIAFARSASSRLSMREPSGLETLATGLLQFAAPVAIELAGGTTAVKAARAARAVQAAKVLEEAKVTKGFSRIVKPTLGRVGGLIKEVVADPANTANALRIAQRGTYVTQGIKDVATPVVAALAEENQGSNYVVNALERDFLAGQQATEVKRGNLDRAAKLGALSRSLKGSKSYEEFTGAKGTVDSIKAFMKDPLGITAQVAAGSMASYGPGMLSIRAGGVFAGRVGAAMGTAATSFQADAGSTWLESFQRMGIDYNDPDQLKDALADPEIMAKARSWAIAAGLSVGVWDGISAGMAGQVFGAPAKNFVSKLIKGIEDLGEQAIFDFGSEATRQAAIQQYDPSGIISEVVGGGPQSVAEIAHGGAIDIANATVRHPSRMSTEAVAIETARLEAAEKSKKLDPRGAERLAQLKEYTDSQQKSTKTTTQKLTERELVVESARRTVPEEEQAMSQPTAEGTGILPQKGQKVRLVAPNGAKSPMSLEYVGTDQEGRVLAKYGEDTYSFDPAKIQSFEIVDESAPQVPDEPEAPVVAEESTPPTVSEETSDSSRRPDAVIQAMADFYGQNPQAIIVNSAKYDDDKMLGLIKLRGGATDEEAVRTLEFMRTLAPSTSQPATPESAGAQPTPVEPPVEVQSEQAPLPAPAQPEPAPSPEAPAKVEPVTETVAEPEVPATPLGKVKQKWNTTRERGVNQARKDLNALRHQGHNISIAQKALVAYDQFRRNRADFVGDDKAFFAARTTKWNQFLEALNAIPDKATGTREQRQKQVSVSEGQDTSNYDRHSTAESSPITGTLINVIATDGVTTGTLKKTTKDTWIVTDQEGYDTTFKVGGDVLWERVRPSASPEAKPTDNAPVADVTPPAPTTAASAPTPQNEPSKSAVETKPTLGKTTSTKVKYGAHKVLRDALVIHQRAVKAGKNMSLKAAIQSAYKDANTKGKTGQTFFDVLGVKPESIQDEVRAMINRGEHKKSFHQLHTATDALAQAIQNAASVEAKKPALGKPAASKPAVTTPPPAANLGEVIKKHGASEKVQRVVAALKALGYDDKQISRMKPETTTQIIGDKVRAEDASITRDGKLKIIERPSVPYKAMTREQFEKDLFSVHHYDPKQVKRIMKLVDAHAKLWAKQNNSTVEEFYATKFAGKDQATDADGIFLYQDAAFGPWRFKAADVLRTISRKVSTPESVVKALVDAGVSKDELKTLRLTEEDLRSTLGDTVSEAISREDLQILADSLSSPLTETLYSDREDDIAAGKPKYDRYTLPGLKLWYRELLLSVRGSDQNFGHWLINGVLMHIRSTARLETGKVTPVTFVEEIQSDWIQRGRETGFAEDHGYTSPADTVSYIEDVHQSILYTHGDEVVPVTIKKDTSRTLVGGARWKTKIGAYSTVDYLGHGLHFADAVRYILGTIPTGISPVSDELVEGSIRLRDAYEGIAHVAIVRDGLTPSEAMGTVNRLLKPYMSAEQIAEVNSKLSLLAEYDYMGDAAYTPRPPMVETWTEVALKRILRQAVEDGHNAITWATADTILHTQGSSEVRWTQNPDGTWSVTTGFIRPLEDAVLNEPGVLDALAELDSRPPNVYRSLNEVTNTQLRKRMEAQPAGGVWRKQYEGNQRVYDQDLPKRMSKYLRRMGWNSEVTETTLELGNGQKATVHKIAITPEMKEAIQLGQYLWQKGDKDQPKGATQFLADGRAIIHSFESGDISTIIHELGHIFRRDLTPEDLAAAEKWAGVEGGKWTVEQEERFARAFERYLYEGDTPITELKSTFKAISEWMRNIYQTLKGSPIDMKLSAEIRGVFDRMLGEPVESEISSVEETAENASVAQVLGEPATSNPVGKTIKSADEFERALTDIGFSPEDAAVQKAFGIAMQEYSGADEASFWNVMYEDASKEGPSDPSAGSLMSEVGGQVRAVAVIRQHGPSIVKFFTGTKNLDDGIEEMAHIFRKVVLVGADLDKVNDLYGVEDGIWTREHEEQWAQDCVKAVRSQLEVSETSGGVRRMLNRFKTWLGTIFQVMSGTPVGPKIHTSVESLLNTMLKDMDLPTVKIARPTPEPAPDMITVTNAVGKAVTETGYSRADLKRAAANPPERATVSGYLQDAGWAARDIKTLWSAFDTSPSELFSIDYKAADQAVSGMISSGEKSPVNKMPWYGRWYAAWKDRNASVTMAVRDILGDQTVDADVDPRVRYGLLRGLSDRVTTILFDSYVDRYGNVLGPSLKETLSEVEGEQDEFTRFCFALHGLDVIRELGSDALPDLPQGIDGAGDTQSVLQALVDQAPEHYYAVQQKLMEFKNMILDELMDAGRLSQAQVDAMSDKWPNHVPMFRVMEESAVGKHTSKMFAKLKGSKRLVIDPMESIVKFVHLALNTAEHNIARRSLAAIADENEPTEWVKYVGLGAEAPTDPMDAISSALEEMGDSNIEDPVESFTRKGMVSGKDNTIVVWKDGVPHEYELHVELFRTIAKYDTRQVNYIANFFKGFAKTLRTGATIIPEFALVRNPLRDTLSAIIFSQHNISLLDIGRAYYEVLHKGDVYRAYKATGASQSGMLSVDRTSLQRQLAAFTDQTVDEKVLYYMRRPWEMLDILRTWWKPLEDAPRVAEFGVATSLADPNKGYISKVLGLDRQWGANKDPAVVSRAALDARDITIDFGRKGVYSAQVNDYVAFFDVALSGPDKMVRSMINSVTNKSVDFLVKGVLAITLPKLWEFDRYKDDEDYDKLDEWVKDMFFLWKIPGTHEFVRIPGPFELMIMFGTIPHRIARTKYKEDPEPWRNFWKDVGGQMLPSVVPTFATPLLEVYANIDYKGAKTVPEREKDFPKPMQYGVNTSETAKFLGRTFNASPRNIEHVIKGWTGGAGNYILNTADALGRVTGAMPELGTRPVKSMGERSMLRGLTTSPWGESRYTGMVYEHLDKLRKINIVAEKGGKPMTEKQINELAFLEKVSATLAVGRRMERFVSETEDPKQLTELCETYGIDDLPDASLAVRKRYILLRIKREIDDVAYRTIAEIYPTMSRR